jgi:hypothetical protein
MASSQICKRHTAATTSGARSRSMRALTGRREGPIVRQLGDVAWIRAAVVDLVVEDLDPGPRWPGGARYRPAAEDLC